MPVVPVPNSPMPSAAAAPQGSAASAQPGQPPIGSSPATQPVPNRGQEAAGLAKLGVAIRVLESILPMVGSGSEVGKDVLKALNSLSKHVPVGSQSSGIDTSALQEMLMKARQMQPQIAAMRAAQGGGQSGAAGAPGGGGDGAMPPAGLAAMMQKAA